LASGKARLREEGHEEEVADRISAPQSKSSRKVYDAQWTVWKTWCEEKGVTPAYPSLPNITSYLNHLFNQGLAVQTIMGHRSMLSSALKFHTDLDITHSQELNQLMMNFRQERPARHSLVPKWDLNLVLWTLLDKPFESVYLEHEVPLTFLTWKVTFLLLLASGLRRGELHNLPFSGVSYDRDFRWITIRPDPAFIHKTRIATGESLQAFTIKSLKDVVGQEEERKLDPCRAVKAYLKRTEKLRGDRKLFLISPDPRHKGEIAVNTISAWISNLIQYAYRQPGAKALELTGLLVALLPILEERRGRGKEGQDPVGRGPG
jgi:hypothetical protein